MPDTKDETEAVPEVAALDDLDSADEGENVGEEIEVDEWGGAM